MFLQSDNLQYHRDGQGQQGLPLNSPALLPFSSFTAVLLQGPETVCCTSNGLESNPKELFLAWTLALSFLPSFPKLPLAYYLLTAAKLKQLP